MKPLLHLPRPSLLWLSVDDVVFVRNAILKLYLSPNEEISAAPPRGFFGVDNVKISGGIIPRFDWSCNGVNHTAWLRVANKPSWHLRNDKMSDGVEALPFNHKLMRPIACLIKHYSRHFPFAPTQNYLQNNGEFIA